MEIQQSPLYASYIKLLGWHVERIDGSNVFIKRFPLLGGFAKLQRCTKLPRIKHLLPILTTYHVKRLAVEPDASVPQDTFTLWINSLYPAKLQRSGAYLPTKTIRIDLTESEEHIFQRFSEAKRRAVRRALKHHVLIKESPDIHVLISVKNRSAGFLGFITTTGIDKLWKSFGHAHAAILLAYRDNHVVGGVLLLFWDEIAYYWIAGATKEGKKFFAPTLLVWEALKLAKKRGCTSFDFVGVWDERIPKGNTNWKGFTKFKEGFGGNTLYYPIATLRQVPAGPWLRR